MPEKKFPRKERRDITERPLGWVLFSLLNIQVVAQKSDLLMAEFSRGLALEMLDGLKFVFFAHTDRY